MRFGELFTSPKPLIACIHLLPLPGSPRYAGKLPDVYETALAEAETFKRHSVDGLIVENFRDQPFYPDRLPAETVAAMAAITREIVKAVEMPVGVNALRNDAHAALAIATAAEADFIRVNVHMHAVVADQGILQGQAHATLRLRAALQSRVLIFADVAVKHAAKLGDRSLALETRDLEERGLVDAIVVSGEATGLQTSTSAIECVRENTALPVLVGSGTTPQNLGKLYPIADGFIVGSYFKKDGKGDQLVQESRVQRFFDKLQRLRARNA